MLHILLIVHVSPLQFRVEVFASLQGSPQHCSLWVDPHILLRPAQQVSDRREESMNKLSKVRSRWFVCIPSKLTYHNIIVIFSHTTLIITAWYRNSPALGHEFIKSLGTAGRRRETIPTLYQLHCLW